MRRTHDPSRLRRRGLRSCRHPQQEAGDAGCLRGEGQLTAGHEIEMPRLAPDLQHHGAQRIAGERVGRCPQRTFHIGCTHRHETARIKAEFRKPAHRQRAHLALAKIRSDPQQRPLPQGPCGQAQHKTGRAGAVPAAFSEHFMHRAQRKAALQRAICLFMAKHNTTGCISAVMRFQTLDASAQSRKRTHACARHRAASLE